jgi:hypothetical protein
LVHLQTIPARARGPFITNGAMLFSRLRWTGFRALADRD